MVSSGDRRKYTAVAGGGDYGERALKDGGDDAQLKGKQADPELARQIIRLDEFEKWQKEYMK
jgi:hypothetical protein